jgi:hypothetical protein
MKVMQCALRLWLCKRLSNNLLSYQTLPAFDDENSQERLAFYSSVFPTLLAPAEHQFDHQEWKMLSRAYLPLYCHINVCTEICAVLGF